MRILSSALVFSSSLVAPALVAQLSFGGHPYGMDRSNALPEAPATVLPQVDATTLMAEDEARSAQGVKGPYRFGFNHAVQIGTQNAGVWHTLSNGDRVWRTAIECPGAFSINLEFHEFLIPDGGQVFVYNELGHVLGAFEANSNPGHNELGVDLLPGDRVTVEYVEPARVAGQGRLTIGQVTHAYRDMFGATKGFGESGSCNNNVICAVGDPWRAQIQSVAMMVTQGNGFCTGQLINNCNNDGIPYFLTANHCMEGTGSNVVFRFNWNSPVCTPNTNGPMNQSVAGYTLLESDGGSDVALLRLNTTPPASYNVFYTGWDRSASAASGGVTAIHHPSGDIKKISFENQTLSSENWGGAQCWRVNDWDNGTTEGGSSGSGLWNQNGLLVGQLFGGYAACGNNLQDYYGKFSVSYPLLQEWLGDCGTSHGGFPDVVGLEEIAGGSELELWPNPTSGQVVLMLPTTGMERYVVRVRDAQGRLVLETNSPTGVERFELDLSEQPGGLYLVEATSGTLRLQQRVVMVH